MSKKRELVNWKKINSMKNFVLLVVMSQVGLNFSQSLEDLVDSYYWNEHCDGELIVLTEEIENCNNNPLVLVFSDEFEGNYLDNVKWRLRPNEGSTGPVQEYNTLDNLVFEDGYCKIKPKRELKNALCMSWEAPDFIMPDDGLTNLREFNYTSSNIWTKKRFKHGYYEIKCKIPKGKGMWPAFWTFFSNNEGEYNEIDVFEFWNEYSGNQYNSDKSSKVVHTNMHYDDGGDVHDKIDCPMVYPNPSIELNLVEDYSQEDHIFGVLWDKQKIIWYIDNQPIRIQTLFSTILGQKIDCNSLTVGQEYLMNYAFPRSPMHIIFNLAIQSNGDAPNDYDILDNISFDIDYIKYYQRMDCGGNIFLSNNSTEIDLDSDVYNVVMGENIFVDDDFTITENQQLELIANNEISISPNFFPDFGSDFSAYINPEICVNSNLSTGNNVLIEKHEDFLEIVTDNTLQDSVSEENLELTKFEIINYPNPTSSIFTIETPNFISNCSIYISDFKGNILFFKNDNSRSYKFDLSQYSQGLYYVNIVDENTQKVYFQRIELK